MATEKTLAIISGIMMIISVGGVEPARSDLWRSLHRGREMRLVNTGGGWLSHRGGFSDYMVVIFVYWHWWLFGDVQYTSFSIRLIKRHWQGESGRFFTSVTNLDLRFFFHFFLLILNSSPVLQIQLIKTKIKCTLSNCSILIYLFVAVSQRAWTSDNRQERLMGI